MTALAAGEPRQIRCFATKRVPGKGPVREHQGQGSKSKQPRRRDLGVSKVHGTRALIANGRPQPDRTPFLNQLKETVVRSINLVEKLAEASLSELEKQSFQ